MEKKIAEEERRKHTALFHTKRQNIYEEYENRLKAVLPQRSFWLYFAGAFMLVLVIFLIIIASKMRDEVLIFLVVIISFIITPFVKNYYTAKAQQSKQYREILQERDLKIAAIAQGHLLQ
jgi:glucan phosphoethanolaminetransferase (alkaline phosphatase superfamily)